MTKNIPYKVRTVELRGSTNHTISVAPAPVEPSFGTLSTFTPKRFAHTKKRKKLIAKVTKILEEDQRLNQQSLPMRAEEAAPWIKKFETATLDTLVKSFSNSESSLIDFLSEVRLCDERTKRELATFRQQLTGVDYKMAQSILDNVRLEVNPLFAYEDLSQMTDSEQEVFIHVLSFYMKAYDKWVGPRGNSREQELVWVSPSHRLRVLRVIPALTPRLVPLLAERPERHDEIIDFVYQQDMTYMNVDEIRQDLNLPAPELQPGFV